MSTNPDLLHIFGTPGGIPASEPGGGSTRPGETDTISKSMRDIMNLLNKQTEEISRRIIELESENRAGKDTARAPSQSEDDGHSTATPSTGEDKPGCTAPDDVRSVNKLIKSLGIKPEGFAPKTEKEYDDTLEGWTQLAISFGHEVRLLKWVVVRAGEEAVREAALKLAMSLPVEDFFNRLAVDLFPFSRQLEGLEYVLDAIDRHEDVEEAIRGFRRQVTRHQRLCKRWGRPNGFHAEKLKECLFKKLPLGTVEKMLTEDWRSLTLTEFYAQCRRVQDGVARFHQLTRTVNVAPAEHKRGRAEEKSAGDKAPPKRACVVHSR